MPNPSIFYLAVINSIIFANWRKWAKWDILNSNPTSRTAIEIAAASEFFDVGRKVDGRYCLIDAMSYVKPELCKSRGRLLRQQGSDLVRHSIGRLLFSANRNPGRGSRADSHRANSIGQYQVSNSYEVIILCNYGVLYIWRNTIPSSCYGSMSLGFLKLNKEDMFSKKKWPRVLQKKRKKNNFWYFSGFKGDLEPKRNDWK